MASGFEDIDDIEDLIAPGDLKPSDRYYNKKDVSVRKREKKSNGKIETEKTIPQNGPCDSVTTSAFNHHHRLQIPSHFR